LEYVENWKVTLLHGRMIDLLQCLGLHVADALAQLQQPEYRVTHH